MIRLLTAVGLTPVSGSRVQIYTQAIHRTTQNKEYIEQHKNFGRVRAVPHLCGFYPGICLTTEEKARKNLSQGSRRVPAGTMKMHKHTLSYKIQHGSVELFVIVVCWLRKQSHECAGPYGLYDGTKAVVAVNSPTVRLYGLAVRSGRCCKWVDPLDFFPWAHYSLPYSHYHEPQKSRFCSVAYPGFFFRGEGSTNAVDGGQRERGSGGVAP